MKEIKVYWTSWGRVRTVAMRSWTIAFVSRYDHLAAVKELKDEVEVKRLVIEAAIEENQSLTSKLQKAVEALKFYGARNNWTMQDRGCTDGLPNDIIKNDYSDVTFTEADGDVFTQLCGGAKARATLKEIGVES